MFKPLSLFIGLRYTRAKRRSGFISFISFASMAGIALGVMVLITVLSVVNGFNRQIRQHFFALAPQVTIMTRHNIAKEWPKLGKLALKNSAVSAYAPFIDGKGMLSYAGQVSGVDIMGIQPSYEAKINELSTHMSAGKLSSLKPNTFNMVVGKKLADQLNLHVGDKLIVLIPQASTSPFGVIPRYKRFTISGIFHVGAGFGFEQGVVYVNMKDAARLFALGNVTEGLHLKLHNLYDAPLVAFEMQQRVPFAYLVTHWGQQFGAFFHALNMEKTMMFVILLLIVAVAAFNLVSSLVMVVNEKQADIAILRTLGMRRSQIMMTFIVQGALIGLIGTLIGIVLGIILSLNATAIVAWLQHLFHVQFISSSVYFVNYLPSHLEVSDVVGVGVAAFILCLLATLYPAWHAFRTKPAEALRYE